MKRTAPSNSAQRPAGGGAAARKKKTAATTNLRGKDSDEVRSHVNDMRCNNNTVVAPPPPRGPAPVPMPVPVPPPPQHQQVPVAAAAVQLQPPFTPGMGVGARSNVEVTLFNSTNASSAAASNTQGQGGGGGGGGIPSQQSVNGTDLLGGEHMLLGRTKSSVATTTTGGGRGVDSQVSNNAVLLGAELLSKNAPGHLVVDVDEDCSPQQSVRLGEKRKRINDSNDSIIQAVEEDEMTTDDEDDTHDEPHRNGDEVENDLLLHDDADEEDVAVANTSQHSDAGDGQRQVENGGQREQEDGLASMTGPSGNPPQGANDEVQQEKEDDETSFVDVDAPTGTQHPPLCSNGNNDGDVADKQNNTNSVHDGNLHQSPLRKPQQQLSTANGLLGWIFDSGDFSDLSLIVVAKESTSGGSNRSSVVMDGGGGFDDRSNMIQTTRQMLLRRCHRVVLATKSPYFARKLLAGIGGGGRRSGGGSSTSATVPAISSLKECNFCSTVMPYVDAVLHYIYNGTFFPTASGGAEGNSPKNSNAFGHHISSGGEGNDEAINSSQYVQTLSLTSTQQQVRLSGTAAGTANNGGSSPSDLNGMVSLQPEAVISILIICNHWELPEAAQLMFDSVIGTMEDAEEWEAIVEFLGDLYTIVEQQQQKSAAAARGASEGGEEATTMSALLGTLHRTALKTLASDVFFALLQQQQRTGRGGSSLLPPVLWCMDDAATPSGKRDFLATLPRFSDLLNVGYQGEDSTTGSGNAAVQQRLNNGTHFMAPFLPPSALHDLLLVLHNIINTSGYSSSSSASSSSPMRRARHSHLLEDANEAGADDDEVTRQYCLEALAVIAADLLIELDEVAASGRNAATTTAAASTSSASFVITADTFKAISAKFVVPQCGGGGNGSVLPQDVVLKLLPVGAKYDDVELVRVCLERAAAVPSTELNLALIARGGGGGLQQPQRPAVGSGSVPLPAPNNGQTPFSVQRGTSHQYHQTVNEIEVGGGGGGGGALLANKRKKFEHSSNDEQPLLSGNSNKNIDGGGGSSGDLPAANATKGPHLTQQLVANCSPSSSSSDSIVQLLTALRKLSRQDIVAICDSSSDGGSGRKSGAVGEDSVSPPQRNNNDNLALELTAGGSTMKDVLANFTRGILEAQKTKLAELQESKTAMLDKVMMQAFEAKAKLAKQSEVAMDDVQKRMAKAEMNICDCKSAIEMHAAHITEMEARIVQFSRQCYEEIATSHAKMAELQAQLELSRAEFDESRRVLEDELWPDLMNQQQRTLQSLKGSIEDTIEKINEEILNSSLAALQGVPGELQQQHLTQQRVPTHHQSRGSGGAASLTLNAVGGVQRGSTGTNSNGGGGGGRYSSTQLPPAALPLSSLGPRRSGGGSGVPAGPAGSKKQPQAHQKSNQGGGSGKQHPPSGLPF